MMQPETWKWIGELSGRVWAVAGPLVGVLVGAWLATRNQKRQWFLDNKRGEYRELLDTLADCGSKFAIIYGHKSSLVEGSEIKIAGEAARNSANVIFSRLFIAQEMQELGMMDRWTKAVSLLQETRDGPRFAVTLDGIMDDIRKAALKDFS
jgi:hypothetical protein